MRNNEFTFLPDEDLAKAFLIVDNMKEGEVISLNRIQIARLALFILCIKQRIDTLNDCEFNEDYTRLKKIQTIARLQNLINNV
jgi:hypothetical protein